MKYLAILLMMGAGSVTAEPVDCSEPQFSPSVCDGPNINGVPVDCDEPQFSPSPCQYFYPVEPEEDDCVARGGEGNCGIGGGRGSGNGTDNEGKN